MKDKNCIGVLSYNKMRLTERCIRSVLDSGTDPETVFLYHNGTSAETREKIRSTFPMIRHKWTDMNTGYSGGFNALMKWIFNERGRSVLFLTNDTTIESPTLSNCLATEKETGAGLIAPLILYLKYPEKIDSSAGFFDRRRFTLSHYHLRVAETILEKNLDYIPGTALWMRADIFEQTGGMDENFHTYWEDADLSFRCHRSGIMMARSLQAQVYHGIGQTCHKKPLYTTWYFHRNRILFCKKYLIGTELEKALQRIHREILEMKARALEKGDRRKTGYLEKLEKLF